MHFCSKADLIICINKDHFRRIKVEWDGPSNKEINHNSYRIIDYENIMNGNPTIKSVFSF